MPRCDLGAHQASEAGKEACSLVPGIHGRRKASGFSRLRMCEIFPEIWETALFWYSSVYGIHITVLF